MEIKLQKFFCVSLPLHIRKKNNFVSRNAGEEKNLHPGGNQFN